MSKSNDLTALCRELTQGRIGRRDFVKQALALGAGVSTIGAALLACGRDGDKTSIEVKSARDEQVAATPKSDPITDPLGTIEKELRIYNWSDYIAEDTIPNFEKEFGVKVIYDTYESNEEMLAKLQAGASGYDLVCPSGYSVPVLRALGLVDKLYKQYLPNLTFIAPVFLELPYDPGNDHTVPWQWGLTGIAYRKDKVKAPPDSWGVFHDAQYKGKMTQADDMRDVIGAWLTFRGKSANSTDPAELEQAKKDALQAKKLLRSYVSAPVKGQLITGDVWIAQLWNGDTAQAKIEQPEIEFAMPKEGGAMWLDTMAIPKKAPHKRAAHEFLNYVLRPEVGAAISTHTGYGTPNRAALLRMEHPVPYPTADERRRLEFQLDLGEHAALWDRVWTEIKAG
jgi:spermidine/putrescine-binding protein